MKVEHKTAKILVGFLWDLKKIEYHSEINWALVQHKTSTLGQAHT